MPLDKDIKATTCPVCGSSFVCGAEAGMQTCWCMEKPMLVIDPVASEGCYCPACLDLRISRQASPEA